MVPASSGNDASALRSWWAPALWVVWLVIAVVALTSGLAYYLTPIAERAYSPLHARYSPAGDAGHGLGVIGSLMIVGGVAMYSTRKRMTRLARLGRLKHWLEVHIFLCTLGPFLVLLHTSFKFGGLVSISFWSMVTVVGSGVVGRYLYVHIPKTIHGHFLTLRELEQRQRELAVVLGDTAAVDAPALASLLVRPATTRVPGAGRALLQVLRSDLGRRAWRARVRREVAGLGVPAQLQAKVVELADEQARLEQAVAVLAPFQRLFRYWHIFHLPLAILMFVFLAIHVAVAAAFGYAWPF